ncbi:hypothetical protein [Alkalimonas amylolytica]|uniref:Uncharacterized protein n=1 Tax=Alkalimonas amylolytica TaxID=152573 RepID=A0A1H4D2T8_ALKAM|nr:hypothetical protein [Alkalimonas amylolytica]SEA67024.1 hypothetical protein SAMN04488051_10544 [Alkalimonas amylolytica]
MRCPVAAFTTLFLSSSVLAYGWGGPEPFRLERLEGRNFVLTEESFLHRISFQPLPVVRMQDSWAEDGWYGTAGSTRSREFYVQSHLQKRVQFDVPMFVGVRFRRDEDLDGRYDRTLFGSGYVTADGSLELGVWGDVRGGKDEVDLQLEAYWRPGPEQWLRATLISPDAMYNSKTYDSSFYQKKPLTLHLAAGTVFADGQQLYGFTNLNRRMEYHQPDLAQQWTDKQYSAGLGWLYPVTANWQLGLQTQGLYGLRQQFQDDALALELRRQFTDTSLELRSRRAQPVTYWGGVRYLSLRERDQVQQAGLTVLEQRDEWMLYAGMAWDWRPWIRLRPSLMLGYADMQGARPDDDEPLHFSGVLAKLVPVIEFHLHQQSGAVIRLNPTIELHSLSFGGGNVQVHIPF